MELRGRCKYHWSMEFSHILPTRKPTPKSYFPCLTCFSIYSSLNFNFHEGSKLGSSLPQLTHMALNYTNPQLSIEGIFQVTGEKE